MRSHRSWLGGRTIIHIVLLAGVAVWLVPVAWTLGSSFKPVSEIFDYPPHVLPHNWTWSNYTHLLSDFPLGKWFLNSFVVSVTATLVGVFLCALGGFGFAKYQFRGKSLLFAILLSSMMVPFAVILIPLFILVAHLHWINTYQALIVPWLAPAFGIFMMRQFITQTISDEMLDAGRIDGASEFGLFWRLVLPVTRPALAALAIWLFLNVYNSFLWPLVVLSGSDHLTLPLGIASILNSLGIARTEYGVVMAAALFAMVPMILLFVLLRKQFIEGLTLGSVKG
jgi:multiple sugar transport system permease protein